MQKKRALLFLSFFGIILSASTSFYFNQLYAQGTSLQTCCTEEQLLKEKDMPTVAEFTNLLWQRESISNFTVPIRFSAPTEAVYIALRSKGKTMAEAWESKGNTLNALVTGLNKARGYLKPNREREIDTIQFILTHSFQKIPNQNGNKKLQRMYANIHRGIQGLEVYYYGSLVERYPPTLSIVSNLKTQNIVKKFQERYSIPTQNMQKHVYFRSFQGEQVLVQLGKAPLKGKATLMWRGNQFVPQKHVTKTSTKELADLASDWLFNNVHKDGRMTYKYWPSRKEESNNNNMIRQWMATVAMGKVAAERNVQHLWNEVEKNIDYNLSKFYRQEGEFGTIEWGYKVKLGAIALAAMAIVEHPRREKWKKQETSIRKTIDSLWHSDGSFTTFYKPKNRDKHSNANFYPGEALLFWSILYQQKQDPELLDKIMKSFRFYRSWHLTPGRRNPAFIPWHTQAYYNVWKLTKNKELKDFIFKMNDWLLKIQEQPKEGVKNQDTLGRFYTSTKRYGPPHSSSTGVYLEGLIDAYNLAVAVNDPVRANTYRNSINAGLRSVMQLQFTDEVDMFYVPYNQRKYVLGGIRTTVYHNEIRCDNIQHNLMGILKIIDSFDVKDYTTQG